MIKLMIFIARKDGLSREEFIDYYETQHVPLAWRIGPRIAAYKRNYFTAKAYGPNTLAVPPFDFDVVTELCFATPEDYAAFKTALREPGVRKQIDDDEKKFQDQSKTWTYIVDMRR